MSGESDSKSDSKSDYEINIDLEDGVTYTELVCKMRPCRPLPVHPNENQHPLPVHPNENQHPLPVHPNENQPQPLAPPQWNSLSTSDSHLNAAWGFIQPPSHLSQKSQTRMAVKKTLIGHLLEATKRCAATVIH
eukprot:Seg4584.1 transcript_id=Seg4584.1/GoldUCD/mRNA.D3Y31 product="hypothetical protein" protein_id=Seg4584.1/GoldUCD/D3Y31